MSRDPSLIPRACVKRLKPDDLPVARWGQHQSVNIAAGFQTVKMLAIALFWKIQVLHAFSYLGYSLLFDFAVVKQVG
jgi:hypothetical protein